MAYDINKGKLGVGVIIRNQEMQFMGALKGGIPLTHNPFVAESLAILCAIKLCKDLHVHHILEGKSHIMVWRGFNYPRCCQHL